LGFWTDAKISSTGAYCISSIPRDDALHTHTQRQHWSTDWIRGAVACLERIVHGIMPFPCVT